MRHRWSLGYVIPRLLVAVFLVDAALRFMSIDPLTFRAWEAVSRYRPAGAAFEPNRRYRNARSYGDLTAMGNLPGLRQYRTEVFTTDALGFRNAAHVLDTQIGAILIGDSFAVGSGVSDDETVSARLGQFWGCVVYNAGSEAWAVVPDQILPILQRLDLRGRTVIRLYSEDSPGKYTVYRPFLVDQRQPGAGAGDYLDRLEGELRAMGVPVLNLAPFLSAQAARHLERGEYLYWLDDIHWNARGIGLAAAAIRAQWPATSAPCGAPPSLVVQTSDGRAPGQTAPIPVRPMSAEVR